MQMCLLNWIVAIVLLAGLPGCNIDSKVILPVDDAAGDPIAGFLIDRPFALEAFDRQKSAFHVVGTITPRKAGNGRMRYKFSLNENAYSLSLQAKKLSHDNYVIRYSETDSGGARTGQSALVFLSLDNGTYFALTNLADKALVDKIFARTAPPALSDMQINLIDNAQADTLSRYFADHRGEFLADQNYIRFRIVK
jgi:hypothetical protein